MATWPRLLRRFGERWRVLFAQLLFGARVSLTIGVLSAVLATLVGLAVAVVAGYFRGRIEGPLMRAVDLTLALQGPATGPVLSGTVTVRDALWSRRFEATPDILKIASGEKGPLGAPAGPSAVPRERTLIVITPDHSLAVTAKGPGTTPNLKDQDVEAVVGEGEQRIDVTAGASSGEHDRPQQTHHRLLSSPAGSEARLPGHRAEGRDERGRRGVGHGDAGRHGVGGGKSHRHARLDLSAALLDVAREFASVSIAQSTAVAGFVTPGDRVDVIFTDTVDDQSSQAALKQFAIR